MTKEELQLELKALIVSALGLEDIKPEDIETDAPLFVDGLGLDSIDALDLGLDRDRDRRHPVQHRKVRVR